MQIRDTLCAQMPYGGGIISYDIVTNDGFGKRHIYERPRRSPRVTRLVQRGFGAFERIISKSGMYAKNITFACSLPTSTSTWRSDHRIGPGGYMSGELKSENINTEKAPTRRGHHPAKDPQSSHHIQPSPRKILVLYTRLFYNTQKTLKTYDQDSPRSTRPSWIAVHT
jgi:hypothetical protein